MHYGKFTSSAVILGMLGAGTVMGMSAITAHADNTLPTATSTTKNDDKGTATGRSDATVQVEDGYLTLDAVPDMNFGMTAKSSTVTKNIPLTSNQGLIDDDGNDSGLLKVTDSRSKVSEESGEATTMPWQLTASLGSFSAVKGDSDLNNSNDWAINLKQKSGENTNNKLPGIYQPSLKSGDNTEHQVMKSSQGNGTGSTSVYYSKARDASLDMGANVPAGQYDAPITWNLNATPDDSVN